MNDRANGELARFSFPNGQIRLSGLDAQGGGMPIIALHAHWMEAKTFVGLAKTLLPEWRVIAPDQRGHGYSDHTATYSRSDYLDDIEALMDHLQLNEVVLLGNSLGGGNAYQFAARRPAAVRALIIEDIGVVIDDDPAMALAWAGFYPKRSALEEKVGPRLAPALGDSFRETAMGWRMAFDPQDIAASQSALNGDHWSDWMASTCPALIIRGADSRVTSATHLADMASRRKNTELVTLTGGHVVHANNPADFAAAVNGFLAKL